MILLLLLYALLMVIGIESIQRESLIEAFSWMGSEFHAFLINYLILMVSVLFLLSITNNVYLAFSINILFYFIFALISNIKSSVLGVPLLPWDLYLNQESLEISKYFVNSEKVIWVIIVVSIILLAFIPVFFFSRVRLKTKARINIGVISFSLLLLILISPEQLARISRLMGISEVQFEQQVNYSQNGAVLAFLLNTRYLKVDSPSNYSEDSVKFVLEQVNKQEKLDQKQYTKPNVIIVMNESFWDPTRLSNVEFNQDPIPTFRSLLEQNVGGWLLSPQFGGATSNVEFEVLTANLNTFLPQGSIPYQQFVKRPMESLAWVFKEKGYNTIGIHTYDGWFYNRDVAYKHLGFDKFLSSEYFKSPIYKGPFISDNELSKKIITQVEQSVDPVFIYAISMQNHGPYSPDRYDAKEIEVTNSTLSKESKGILETYAQGVRDADESLRTLVNYFQENKEPTIILFFGDHLPGLGDKYKVYAEANFINSNEQKEWTLNEKKLMHNVPFVIWSNYKQSTPQFIDSLSTAFVGPLLLDFIGMEKEGYFEFVGSQAQKLKGYIRPLSIDVNNNMFSELPSTFDQWLNSYWLIQYDNMFGKRYGFENFQSTNQESSIVIERVYPSEIIAGQHFNEIDGEDAIAIEGAGFLEKSSIYANGIKLDTAFGGENLLTAILPKKFYSNPGNLEIQVKLVNSKNTVIDKSNIMVVKVERSS